MNGQFPQIFRQFSQESVETVRWRKNLLTNIRKNPILDVAGVLQNHLGGVFLGWTLLKDERNNVHPSVIFFQKQELNPALYN